MRAQLLDRSIRCYRIGDPEGEFPIFSAEGARLYPGRWNTAQTPLIYAAEHFATTMLESLTRFRGAAPVNQHWIAIELDAGLTYEVFSERLCRDWDAATPDSSRAYGAAWASERRSLLLFVPSVVARVERNVLINPAHPEFARVRHSLHERVWWDERLFGG